MAVEGPKTGLLDLENELTCSICTEVFYQPLTLLDCLHTFCGSCLKEWFALQANQAAHSSRATANPFTCPSCRTTVRETRPDAKVTTLLDMFLQVNPDKAKTAQEKDDIARKYKPGEDVMPVVRPRTERREESEDRRILEEVRERSLMEGLSPPANGSETRNRSTSRETREREGRHRRRREEERRRRREGGASGQTAESSGSRRTDADLRYRGEDGPQPRRIEHQSSLRSLIGTSDGDNTMEEEILRQIIDEGLLENINLDGLDSAQEDEISQRIADAYRQRHQNRLTGSQAAAASPDSRSDDCEISPDGPHSSERQHARPRSQSSHLSNTDIRQRPPVSRSQLLETPAPSTAHRRRASDQGRRRTSPNPQSSRTLSDEVVRSAARSATDLTNRPQTSETAANRPRHLSDTRRTTTEPEPRISEIWRRGGNVGDSGSHTPPQITDSPVNTSPRARRPPPIEPPDSAALVPPPQTTPRARQLSHLPTSMGRHNSPPATAPQARTTLFPEPSVSCDRCGKAHIEYELHKNCSRCKDSNYNLCLRCYRLGRGCDHWFGFGSTAQARLEQSAPHSPSAPKEPPHVLLGHKYLCPADGTVQPKTAENSRTMTTDDPAQRLQKGMFCDNCQAFANACFWRCSTCNEGEWGFCNDCVNQHKCCKHPLQPLAHASSVRSHILPSDSSPLPSPNPDLNGDSASSADTASERNKDDYLPLTFSTSCDICSYPIPPSRTRFHCPVCNGGNLDICTPCYLSLVSAGKISKENGNAGWRRCPSGHRMIVIGFEDHELVQRRVVVRDLVGGHALRDDAAPPREGDWSWVDNDSPTDGGRKTKRRVWHKVSAPGDGESAQGTLTPTHRFPPDGGIGMRCLARWSWIPEDGENGKDELLFPKGAVVSEAEDINGDWFWGVYAGKKGTFPGKYVWVLETVGL